MLKNLYLICIFLFFSCHVFDEEPPKTPEGLYLYFSMSDSIPFVKIKWNKILDDNIDKYYILKSVDGDTSEYILDSSKYFYIDTDINWLETYNYQIFSKDFGKNFSDKSDAVTIYCYKPSGRWIISGDSINFCVDSSNHSVPGGFDIYSGNLDTIYRKAFSPFFLDTNTWNASGWMTKSKLFKDTTIQNYTNIISDTLDTIISNIDTSIITFYTITIYDTTIDDIIINEFPEDYEINLSDPSSGLITFLSDMQSINLVHSNMKCNGENIFP